MYTYECLIHIFPLSSQEIIDAHGLQCTTLRIGGRRENKLDEVLVLFFFNFIFGLCMIVLVLPSVGVNPPQVYMAGGFRMRSLFL